MKKTIFILILCMIAGIMPTGMAVSAEGNEPAANGPMTYAEESESTESEPEESEPEESEPNDEPEENKPIENEPELAPDDIVNVSGGWTAVKGGLETGYYTVTAQCTNTSVMGTCYLYAESASSTRATAVVPRATEGDAIAGMADVTVKGVYVDDGVLYMGLVSDGTSAVVTKDVKLTRSDEPFTFLQGGDISEYSIVVDNGGKYYSLEGDEVDAIAYLAENNMNAARIRLSNNPGKGRGDGTYYLKEGYQDEEDCLSLAKKAKENGMQIVFTFNYSDYWSNAQRQIIPQDWADEIQEELGYDIKSTEFLRSMTSDQKTEIVDKLSDIIYDYTYNYMLRLKEQGTTPEYVSLGNEINGGVLFPFGNSYNAYMDAENKELVFDDDIDTDTDVYCTEDWASMAKMLNAGYDAVKAASEDTQVIIHLAEGSKNDMFKWFFDEYKKAGGKFDIVGASYYPYWTYTTVEDCRSFCDFVGKRYGCKVLLMETGYNFTPEKKDGYDGQLKNIPAYADIYPDSQEGHKGYMTDLLNSMRASDCCMGVLYWDPIKIHVEDEDENNLIGWAYRESDDGVETNVVENTALFDFDGKAIKTMELFRDTLLAQSYEVKYGDESMSVTEDGNTVKAEVQNNSENPVAGMLLYSSYDENGKLTDVELKATNTAAGETESFAFEDVLNDGVKQYSVRLWRRNLTPLTDAFNKTR